MFGNETRFGGRKAGSTNLPSALSLSPADSCDSWRPIWTRMERLNLGAEFNSTLFRWKIIVRNCRPAVALAARRVRGAPHPTIEMSENPTDDSGIGDDGDNLHLCAADTEKRIHLENLLDEAGPGCPESLNELRGGIGRCARACRRRGLLLARGFRRTCAVGERSVIPHAMPKLPS